MFIWLVDLPDAPELMEISLDDEKLDDQLGGDPEKGLVDDPGMGQPKVEQGVKDTGSTVFGDEMSNSFDLNEKPKDEYDSDYDSL